MSAEDWPGRCYTMTIWGSRLGCLGKSGSLPCKSRFQQAGGQTQMCRKATGQFDLLCSSWLNVVLCVGVCWRPERAMATHSSTLAWKIPGTAEPGGLLSMGSHRVGHDWSDLAAVAAAQESREAVSTGRKDSTEFRTQCFHFIRLSQYILLQLSGSHSIPVGVHTLIVDNLVL